MRDFAKAESRIFLWFLCVFGRLEHVLHLIRREPAEHGHGNVVAAMQIVPLLVLQIFKGVEFQEIVKPLLIVSVTFFYLSVVPRRFRSNRFVNYMNIIAKHIKGVDSCCFGCVAKLTPVVCPDCFRCIS